MKSPIHPFKHLKKINKHRHLVRKYCFRLGLYKQGLLHDLSKYSPSEFWRGAKYYTGTRNPVAAERRDKGISLSWLHHRGRNKHHPEYWVDYTLDANGTVGFGANKMPLKYIAEMFCDSIAASKTYLGDKYSDSAVYERFMKEKGHKMIHPETAAIYEKMLKVLKDEGEDAAFDYVKELLKAKK